MATRGRRTQGPKGSAEKVTTLRLDRELFHQVSLAAARAHETINQWIRKTLRAAVEKEQ